MFCPVPWFAATPSPPEKELFSHTEDDHFDDRPIDDAPKTPRDKATTTESVDTAETAPPTVVASEEESFLVTDDSGWNDEEEDRTPKTHSPPRPRAIDFDQSLKKMEAEKRSASFKSDEETLLLSEEDDESESEPDADTYDQAPVSPPTFLLLAVVTGLLFSGGGFSENLSGLGGSGKAFAGSGAIVPEPPSTIETRSIVKSVVGNLGTAIRSSNANKTTAIETEFTKSIVESVVGNLGTAMDDLASKMGGGDSEGDARGIVESVVENLGLATAMDDLASKMGIADSEGDARGIIESVVENLGLATAMDDLASKMGGGDGEGDARGIVESVVENLGLATAMDDLASFVTAKEQLEEESMEFFPGLEKFKNHLHGHAKEKLEGANKKLVDLKAKAKEHKEWRRSNHESFKAGERKARIKR